MIALILFDEVDNRTHKKTGRKLVSHGVDIYTLETVVLPSEPPEHMGHFDPQLGEWVLKD